MFRFNFHSPVLPLLWNKQKFFMASQHVFPQSPNIETWQKASKIQNARLLIAGRMTHSSWVPQQCRPEHLDTLQTFTELCGKKCSQAIESTKAVHMQHLGQKRKVVKPQAKDALPQKDNGLESLCQETTVLSQAKALIWGHLLSKQIWNCEHGPSICRCRECVCGLNALRFWKFCWISLKFS